MNILITSMGANTALTAVKLFNNVRIIGTDIKKDHEIAGSKFCDKFFIVPRYDEPNYVDKIIEICENEKVDAIIPIYDGEIEVLAKNRNKIKAKLVASPYETVRICNDKWETYKFFISNKIPTPKTCLENVSKNIGNNVIYKPRRGIGTQGFIDNGLIFESPPSDYIAQEKIVGQEYTIDCFCDKNGQLIYAVPRKRIEVRFGICYKGETVKNDIFLENLNKLVKFMKFYGPINVQVIINYNDEHFFIEINPRLGASTVITKAAGIDIGDYILKLINDIELKPVNEYELIRMNRYLSEVFFSLK